MRYRGVCVTSLITSANTADEYKKNLGSEYGEASIFIPEDTIQIITLDPLPYLRRLTSHFIGETTCLIVGTEYRFGDMRFLTIFKL